MIFQTDNYKYILADSDHYDTVPRKNRIIINPSFHFYSKLMRIIVRSGRLAKKGLYDGIAWTNSSIAIMEALESAHVQIEIRGMNSIARTEGPVIFISNHMSTLETVILPGIIQPLKAVTFVVKKELLNYPYFGTLLAARNPIVVGRSNPREDLMRVIEEGSTKIKAGESIILFPQKTRSTTVSREAFNSLGVKLAKRTGASIIPVALVTDAWGNGKYLKDMGKIDPSKKSRIAFGESFKVKGSGTQEHEEIVNFIVDSLQRWHRTDCLEQ